MLNFVPGPGKEVGESLIKHDGVIGIAVTGSKKTGRHIQKVCALHPCRYGFKEIVAGEFGGKGAIIIDSDANIDEAVKVARDSGFEGAGQKCSAGSRNIVLHEVYDSFLLRLVETTRSIIIGNPEDHATFMGPLISREQMETVRRYVRIGKREARVAYEGRLPGELVGKGYYQAPVIFADVPIDARIAQEEIFGPVISVIKANDLDQAIEFFNNSQYALTGGIFSRLQSHCERAERECEAGNFYINRKITGALVGRQPFGGWKYSGVGSKVGSKQYLLRFMYNQDHQ